MCVCVCMCVCECMCVCLQSSTVESSPICNDVLGILECTDQRSCVVGIMLDTSHKILTNICYQDKNLKMSPIKININGMSH